MVACTVCACCTVGVLHVTAVKHGSNFARGAMKVIGTTQFSKGPDEPPTACSPCKKRETPWFKCDQMWCSYKCRTRDSLKRHKSCIHNIDVVWYVCDHEDCTFMSKVSSALRRHKLHVHDDTDYHVCPHPGCTFRSKQADSLARHQLAVHIKSPCPLERLVACGNTVFASA